MAFEWYFEYYLNITMTVAKMGDIQFYVVRVISLLLGCYLDVTQMVFLCRWIIYMYNTSYISYDIYYNRYIISVYDMIAVIASPSQNQNRSTCAQACVTCTVISD